MKEVSLWFERWFLSSNAKDIGTLYLIFSLFSGLIGTAFSILVRLCAVVMVGINKDPHYLTEIMMSSNLGPHENVGSNLACLTEVSKAGIHINATMQDIAPMVKVILLELHPLAASGKGLVHVWYWYYMMITVMLIWTVIGYIIMQVISNDLKVESEEPKGAIARATELRDCLTGSSYIPHGNRASIVGISLLKGGRANGIGLITQHIGVQCYSTKRDLPKRFEKLLKFCEDRKPNTKVSDIYKLLFQEKLYEIAYGKLRSNPGNMTPGINPITLDGMNSEWIQETINAMKDGSFQFKPGRRVQIPKPGSDKKRPLTIAPPRDKIVQEVIRMILEPIFEPRFSDNSHGFRPNKSCHTALKQVKTQFGAVTTIIEGDITKCFDSFDHQVLIDLIKREINDERFIQLIWKAIRAGYMEFHTTEHSIIGTPQGSIISPILSNIYLSELDKFVEELKASYDKGTRARINPVYKSLENKRQRANKAGDFQTGIQLLKQMQLVKSRLPNDPNFRRLYYVRYADDWIIGIRGPLTDAKGILLQIKSMLNTLKLDLSEEKTKITNPRKVSALFLGTEIRISRHFKATLGKHNQMIKSVSQIRLLAPMSKIFSKLHSAGFLDLTNKRGIPKFLWLPNEKDDIIKLYNSVIRGYTNYYSFTHNYPRVASSIEHILRTSCARLLAAKFKIHSVARVIAKYGMNLKGGDNVGLIKPSYKTQTWNFKTQPSDKIKAMYTPHLAPHPLSGLTCAKCGTDEHIEMHHVRLLSDLNPKLSEIDKLMAKRRRKQIPLCRACHLDHHKKEKPWGRRKGKSQ